MYIGHTIILTWSKNVIAKYIKRQNAGDYKNNDGKSKIGNWNVASPKNYVMFILTLYYMDFSTPLVHETQQTFGKEVFWR